MRMGPETPPLGHPNQVSGTRHRCVLVEDKAPLKSHWEMLCSFYSFFQKLNSLLVHFFSPFLKVCDPLKGFMDQLLSLHTYTYSHAHMYVHDCWGDSNGVLMNSSEGVLGPRDDQFQPLKPCSHFEVTGEWKESTEVI